MVQTAQEAEMEIPETTTEQTDHHPDMPVRHITLPMQKISIILQKQYQTGPVAQPEIPETTTEQTDHQREAPLQETHLTRIPTPSPSLTAS